MLWVFTLLEHVHERQDLDLITLEHVGHERLHGIAVFFFVKLRDDNRVGEFDVLGAQQMRAQGKTD
jgi:hypothetical protein